MNNVTIFYQGGSGGFALYYYLLLSGQYQYDIATVKSMIAEQFPEQLKTAPITWKNLEFWPNNIELKHQSGNKVFLICNPLFDPLRYETNKKISDDTYKILLYTDLHLQLRLAYEKNAYWFTKVSREYFNAPANTKEYMRFIINSGKYYNDTLVDPVLPDIIDKFNPTQIVRLEELINTKILPSFSEPTQHQVDFLNYWHSLQPTRAIRMLKS